MKYRDGSETHLGDRVKIKDGDAGVIIVSLDTDEYSADWPKEIWGKFKSGVIVRTDKGILVRFDDPLPTELLDREPR